MLYIILIPIFALLIKFNAMKNFRIEAVILAIGLMLLGVGICKGLKSITENSRVVSVRGLAEREVKADRVIWPILYKTMGNDLQYLYEHVNDVNQKTSAFLRQNGISEKEISVGAPAIEDLWANRYGADPSTLKNRYTLTSVITVSTSKVDKVLELMPRMGELMKQGIAISANDYSSQVQFEFSSLNSIKPAMIEEATKNAREAAIKFANDSGSKIGKIKRATQGLFSIENRDQYNPHIKQVRVVTSIDYFLEN